MVYLEVKIYIKDVLDMVEKVRHNEDKEYFLHNWKLISMWNLLYYLEINCCNNYFQDWLIVRHDSLLLYVYDDDMGVVNILSKGRDGYYELEILGRSTFQGH